MNIAFAAIIIVIALLPGAVGLHAYYHSLRAKESIKHQKFDELIFKGIIISLFTHFIGIVSLLLFNYYPLLNLLYDMLTGKDINVSDKDLTNYFIEFIAYTFTLLIFTFFIAKFIRAFVKRKKLEVEWFGLNYTNYWFHIFSARFYNKGDVNPTDLIIVEIQTCHDYVYSGLLKDFNYSAHNDELESVILVQTRKIKLTHEGDKPQSRPDKNSNVVSIKSDIFVIIAKTIISLDVYYVKIKDPAPVINTPVKLLPPTHS